DPQHHVEIAVAPQIHVAHVSHAHAGEQHRLSLLEVLPPGEPRVQRIAGLQSAAHQPQRAEDEHDDGDGDEHADRDFVATFHVWSRGPSTPAVRASSTRMVTEAMTTARAVDRPTPSAPASVM